MRKIKMLVAHEGCEPEVDGWFVNYDEVKHVEEVNNNLRNSVWSLQQQLENLKRTKPPVADVVPRSVYLDDLNFKNAIIDGHTRTKKLQDNIISSLKKSVDEKQQKIDTLEYKVRDLNAQLNKISDIMSPF